MNMLVLIKTVVTLIIAVMQMVRDGQIKTGAYDEVLHALAKAFDKRKAAVEAAMKKGPVDESVDIYNRARADRLHDTDGQ